jgi:hypothetical protein
MKQNQGVIVFSLLLLSCVATFGQAKPEQIQKSEPAPSQSGSGIQQPTPSGVEILSDTEGVNFKSFLQQWHRITRATWDGLTPPVANSSTAAKVTIRFKILPDGKIKEKSMILEGRSGNTSLDRAAWFALIDSHYPSLPSEFHGPYLELRAIFLDDVMQH